MAELIHKLNIGDTSNMDDNMDDQSKSIPIWPLSVNIRSLEVTFKEWLWALTQISLISKVLNRPSLSKDKS